MRRTRGSAILFVVVLLAAATTILVATSTLSTNALEGQSRREDAAAAQCTLDGAIAQVMADSYAGTLVLPSTRTFKLGSGSCSITITDNSSSIAHTLYVDSTTTVHNRTYHDARVVAAPFVPQPFYYSLFVNGNLTAGVALNTGGNGSNGDVCANGNVQLTGPLCTVNGDLEATGSIQQGLTSVTGTVWPNAPSVTFPSLNQTTLTNSANRTISGSTLFGFTFNTGTTYDLVYHAGPVTISGAFSGNGTIFATGDITVSADVTYATSSSHVVFITTGKVVVQSTVRNIAGYFYTPSSFTLQGTLGKTLTRGAIICGSFSSPIAVTLNYDPYIWSNPTEAPKLHIPGFWP